MDHMLKFTCIIWLNSRQASMPAVVSVRLPVNLYSKYIANTLALSPFNSASPCSLPSPFHISSFLFSFPSCLFISLMFLWLSPSPSSSQFSGSFFFLSLSPSPSYSSFLIFLHFVSLFLHFLSYLPFSLSLPLLPQSDVRRKANSALSLSLHQAVPEHKGRKAQGRREEE